MKKTIITLFLLLAGALLQTYGQPPVGSTLLFTEDFGGNNPSDTTVAKVTTLPPGTTNVNFVPGNRPAGIGGPRPGNNEYSLAKYITPTIAYPHWWGGTDHPARPFEDHTFPNDTTRGYMMVVNADATPSVFFNYTIHDLCPNTQLYFSIYVGNLLPDYSSTSGQSDPSLTFTLLDSQTGTPLVGGTYTTGTIPKSSTTAGPTWVQEGFPFTSGSSDSITLQISNATLGDNGNDLVLDDIEIWVTLPEADVSTSGAGYYCEGDPMNLSANFTDNGIFGNNVLIQWLFSTDSTAALSDWIKIPVTGPVCNLPVTAETEGFYRALVGDSTNIANNRLSCSSASDPMQVILISTATLYWKQNPTDQNWDNPANWQQLDGSGNLVDANIVPATCTDVHIPGNATLYPSLDTEHTPKLAVCHDIWFHFGGLIGQPQLLNYNYAYVQYNWGVNNGGVITNEDIIGGQPTQQFSTDPMKRDQWYALAAPLQRMASGDFAVGGFPSMWQMQLQTSPNPGTGPNEGPDSNGTLDTYWYLPANTNNWDIGRQYNAIAVWVDGDPSISLVPSYDYQQNLNGLNGILEMPYFENTSLMNGFRRNWVDQQGAITTFGYYYGNRTDFPMSNVTNDFDRVGREAYRFIFEGAPFSGSDGIYTLDVSSNVNDLIMVGNPFMSQLDFDAFAEANSANGIDDYSLYVNGSFVSYSITAGAYPITQYIAPLQAFFITPTSSPLTFNANDEALADPHDNKLRASANNGNQKPDVLYLKAENKTGVSWLTLSMQNVVEKNLPLLLSAPTNDSSKMPCLDSNLPQLYATDATGQKNCIQFEGGYVEEVPFGIISSDSTNEVTLTVFNQDKINAVNLVLHDNLSGKDIDLKNTDSYTFVNAPATPDRFVLRMSNVVTGITPEAVETPVRASVSGNTLRVSAVSKIADVSVITLQGITLSKDTNIGQTSFSTTLNFRKGIYLVSVKLETGETKVLKIKKA